MTTAVEVTRHWVAVLLALTLLGSLHPLNGVALWPDTNATSILEDDHSGQCPEDQPWSDNPDRELLQPGPVRSIVLREVTIIDRVEGSGRHKGPVLPVVAVVPDRLHQWVLLRGAIWLVFNWWRRRKVQE